jgi:hypothetical protein
LKEKEAPADTQLGREEDVLTITQTIFDMHNCALRKHQLYRGASVCRHRSSLLWDLATTL